RGSRAANQREQPEHAREAVADLNPLLSEFNAGQMGKRKKRAKPPLSPLPLRARDRRPPTSWVTLWGSHAAGHQSSSSRCGQGLELTGCGGERGAPAMTRSKAQEDRSLAQEGRAFARPLSTAEGRAQLMAMAEVWERLADQQEQGSDFTGVSAPAAEQSAIQQQQQIQPKDDDNEE